MTAISTLSCHLDALQWRGRAEKGEGLPERSPDPSLPWFCLWVRKHYHHCSYPNDKLLCIVPLNNITIIFMNYVPKRSVF